jgi:hypothetical protein
MLNQNEGLARVVGEMAEKILEGVQTSGRGSYSNHRDTVPTRRERRRTRA